MTLPIKVPFTLTQLAKQPTAVLAYVFIGYFLWDVFIKPSETDKCELVVIYWQLKYDKKEQDLNDLKDAFLVKSYALDILKRNTDSVAMEKIGYEAKQHIK